MAGQTQKVSSTSDEETPLSRYLYRAGHRSRWIRDRKQPADPTERVLLDVLAPFSHIVEQNTAHHAAYNNGRISGVPLIDSEEIRSIADTSVYLAFVELGGDPDVPEVFDVEALGVRVVELACASAYDMLRGPGSTYRDWSQRWRCRAEGKMIDSLKWTAWVNAGDTEDDTRSLHNTMIDTSDDPFLPKSVAKDWDSDALVSALRSVLSEDDARALVTHFIDEKSFDQMATDELAAHGVTDPSPDVFRKLKMAVYQRVCRAKARAAKRLGSAWVMRAEEIV